VLSSASGLNGAGCGVGAGGTIRLFQICQLAGFGSLVMRTVASMAQMKCRTQNAGLVRRFRRASGIAGPRAMSELRSAPIWRPGARPDMAKITHLAGKLWGVVGPPQP
jgi:hypothetical protein